MKILNVTANNFRSYEELDWALPESGLALLDAKNLDTGGSNFAGKSTILDSIFWGLYGWLPRWNGPKGGPADAVIRRGEKSCSVQLVLKINQDTYTIKRSRPSKLSVIVNNESLHGKTDDLQNTIDTKIMTPAKFLTCVYASQDRTASFFTMGDVERTELLSTIAGLEALDGALSRAKEDRTRLESSLISVNAKLEMQKARLDEIPVLIEEHKTKTQLQYGAISELKKTQESAELFTQTELDSILSNYNTSISSISDSERIEVAELHSKLDKLSITHKDLSNSLTETPKPEPHLEKAVFDSRVLLMEARSHNKKVDAIEKDNDKIVEKIKKLAQEAESCVDGTCGSCGQGLPQWHTDSYIKERLDKAGQLEVLLQEVPERKIEDDTLVRQAERAFDIRKAELDAKPAQIRSEITAIRAQIAETQANLNSVTMKASSERGRLLVLKEQSEREAKKTLNGINEVISKEEAKLDILFNKLKELEADLEKQGTSFSGLMENKRALDKELQVILDLVELFGPKGYRSVCFDGLVDRIGQRAGQLLSIMTDGLYSTRLDQVANDSKGGTKLILKPVIIKSGTEVPNDDLSGGARKRVMLAYDMSVSEAAESDAPIFLDEALDGLDAVGKQEVMVLLEEVSRNRPVIVVDHASEMKSSFNNVISVEYNKGISRMVQ